MRAAAGGTKRGAPPAPEASARPLDGVRALFLSYDGLTDPLGQSQVLPYLAGLARHGAAMHVVSFEKPARFRSSGAALRRLVEDAGVAWTPLRYTKRPPVISAMWDLLRLRRTAERLDARHSFDIVHCRSYLPSLVGLRLKRRRGTKFLFDMRGFWSDERVDAGLWPQAHPLYRAIYHYFRAREREFLAEADAIVSLTRTAVSDLENRHAGAAERTSVIPCSVDYDRFVAPAEARAASRATLGIPADACVAAYVGSTGTWYMMAEMMAFFRAMLAQRPRAWFLIITPDQPATVLRHAGDAGVPPERVVVRSASHDEVPRLLTAADFGLFFIRAGWSKRSSSPTKLAEYLALGLPVITGPGIGDVEADVTRFGAGVVVRSFTPAAYAEAVHALDVLLARPPRGLRESSRRTYGLEHAIASYVDIYQTLAAGHA